MLQLNLMQTADCRSQTADYRMFHSLFRANARVGSTECRKVADSPLREVPHTAAHAALTENEVIEQGDAEYSSGFTELLGYQQILIAWC